MQGHFAVDLARRGCRWCPVVTTGVSGGHKVEKFYLMLNEIGLSFCKRSKTGGEPQWRETDSTLLNFPVACFVLRC